MNFITENLLTILILLPVFGAIGLVAHQMFWKNERPSEMGDACGDARYLFDLAAFAWR